jgi:hypothetical protein
MLAQPVALWVRHRAMRLPTAQHLLSMNFAISSGEEKVAAARSPSIPVGMIAGAPLSGPIPVGIGHETQIVLPEGARLFERGYGNPFRPWRLKAGRSVMSS